jgi:hypothetical protein
MIFWTVFFLACAAAVFGQTGTHGVTLTWGAVTNATGYNVYKAQAACAGATFAKVTAMPLTATTFSETGYPDGATRCFYVTAVNAAGESTPSGTIQITTPAYTAPVAAAIQPPATVTSAVQ